VSPQGLWSRRERAWLLLFAGGVAISVTFLALLWTELLGPTGTVILDDYTSTLGPAGVGLLCLRASRRANGRSRRAWFLLGLSVLSWALGSATWTVYEVHLGSDIPFPSLADVGYLLSVPLAVAALLTFPGARATGVARLRPLLDGIVAAGALLFVSWTTVLGPTFHAGTGSLLAQGISLAYPAGDVLNATIALLLLARARGEQRFTVALIAIALLIEAVADSSFAWFSAQGAYATGNLIDAIYLAGYLLIGLAALRPPAPPPDADEVDLTPSRLALSLPYLPILVSLPFAVVLHQRGNPIDPFLFYTSLVAIIAVLARQLLSLQVNVALSRQLHDTVATLRRREIELNHQALHDPLTGLANRALFADRIGHALASTRRPTPVILLLADLDDFKAVNDTLGHPAGDALLIGVADRLRAVVRPEDTVARLGGDEFAVLLEDTDGLTGARRVAERIAEALEQPFDLGGVRMVIGASIGIAAAGSAPVGDASIGDALLLEADIAMYAAKAEGKGRYAVYAADLAAANIGRLQLKGDLSEALARDELSLMYQPIVDVASGALVGVEALLRWTHPVQGSVSPSEFIPLAEASGAILPIGRWVLSRACAQAASWQLLRPAGMNPLELAVNVSGRQLIDRQLLPTVRAALADSGLAPHLLTLELTESVLFAEEEGVMAALVALRGLGVRLAIDDFGTGHSSLSRLSQYPIDTLKVDRSFINALTPDAPVPDVLVTAILALGGGLGMQVIAEGVETEEQLAALRALGCPQAQGFLFARPGEPDIIGELIREGIALADPPKAHL
jgi:diguanylate cyclase (GGDEF)-like protein